MKQFVTIIAVIAAVFSFCNNSNAQVHEPITVIKTGDTLNATNDTVYINLMSVPNGLTSVEINISKVSGTLAGSARLQQSNGGSIWYDAGSSINDTLAIGNTATQGKLWSITTPGTANLRLMLIRTNGVAIPTVYYVRREE